MKKNWLVTTDHLEEELWFRDVEDFKVAMNLVAVQSVCCPDVQLLAFILMTNHVHFVQKGEKRDVELFIRQFKQRYSIYYSKKWGIKKFLKLNGVDIREIPGEEEALERTIAYVQMNCVAANICAHPSQYPWGTGSTFFSLSPHIGTKIGDLSVRERERMLHSNCRKLPGHWTITPDGYILPGEYVSVKVVEALFRTPKRMNYFLSNSSKASKMIEAAEHLPAFRDQIILAALPDLCRSLFQKESFQMLSEDEQAEYMRQIRFRFSADLNQIARVCGLSYANAAHLIDRV